LNLSPELHQVLSRGDEPAAERVTAYLAAAGERRQAALGCVLLASRRHDARRLLAIASSEGDILRADIDSRRVLARALYWTVGIQAAGADLHALATESAEPDATDRAMAALAKLVGERDLYSADISVDRPSPFLAGHELPIVLASIDNRAPEYFIVDSGAPTTLLSRTYCDTAGIHYLREYPHPTRGGSGDQLQLFPALLERISFGGASFYNCTAQVALFPQQFQVAGILSPLDTCRAVQTELDFRARVLRVYAATDPAPRAGQSDGLVEKTDLTWDDGNIYVRASVDRRHAGYFLLDSGAGANILTLEFARRIGKKPSGSDTILSATMSGEALVSLGVNGSLAVGHSRPIRTEFMLKEWQPDPAVTAALVRAGYVGTPWMRGRRLVFPPNGCELFFTDRQD
jgi:predicted aspartyl protease